MSRVFRSSLPIAASPAVARRHYGHKPGFEWWRTRKLAIEEGWTRAELIAYENNPSHFQIEDPLANMSHRFELPK